MISNSLRSKEYTIKELILFTFNSFQGEVSFPNFQYPESDTSVYKYEAIMTSLSSLTVNIVGQSFCQSQTAQSSDLLNNLIVNVIMAMLASLSLNHNSGMLTFHLANFNLKLL